VTTPCNVSITTPYIAGQIRQGLFTLIISLFTLQLLPMASCASSASATSAARTSSTDSGQFSTNYAEALQKSIYFYEAQQSGVLPAWNRVPWRGDSTTHDGMDVGIDLSGGWYDAGDYIKFGFPMASAATMLAWGAVEYPQAYQQSGQWQHLRNNLKFVADYLVAAHPQPNLLYGQVGLAYNDHSWWGPAEVLEQSGSAASKRPSMAISPNCPGSDLAGETAAALAATAMVFADDPPYASMLLQHARDLYEFANQYRGKYSDCITDARGYYKSWSGYQDELVWAALWLYRATGQSSYLKTAENAYSALNDGSKEKSWRWTHSWDDKRYGSYILLAQLTNKPVYRRDTERWLDFWTTGYKGHRVFYSPGGMAQLDQWGSSRYAANTAWCALVYADYLQKQGISQDRQQIYYQFAVHQMEYLLGNNPEKISYEIGMGSRSPQNPHHRGSHGSWSNDIEQPVNNRHPLIGALVGGPFGGDNFEDNRRDYVANETGITYNAGFTSALARLYLDFGGKPIAERDFPPHEITDDEYVVFASLRSKGPRHINLLTRIENRTGWPARAGKQLALRYWVDLGAEQASGHDARDIEVSSGYNQASAISQLQPWGNPALGLYYTEIRFDNNPSVPGSLKGASRDAEFSFWINHANAWQNQQDPSWGDYNEQMKPAPAIALYEGKRLVWGKEPCTQRKGMCASALHNLPTDTAPTIAIRPETPQSRAQLPGNSLRQLPATASGPGITATSALKCHYQIKEQWPGGFQAEIHVQNPGKTSVSEWELRWTYQDGSHQTRIWNANAVGSSTIIASPTDWNRTIPSGGSIIIRLEGATAGIGVKASHPRFETGCTGT
jgi:endoglucanase